MEKELSKRSLREETEKLMRAAPGDTIKCPDCGKVCVSGAFFIKGLLPLESMPREKSTEKRGNKKKSSRKGA